MKIRKGDTVVVLSGKDKGRQGEVMSVLPKRDKVIVSGINTVKRHTKARRANEPGGVIDRDMPIHVSNLALVHKGKPTKVGYRIQSDGTKVRVARSTGEVI